MPDSKARVAALRRRSTPTIAEVAELAGVSRTTVSFVLNDVRSMNISEATRQKVFDAARTLGYEPHAAARSLAGGSTGTVAVLIPRSDHLHVDAFLPRLLSAVNDRCHLYGYKVLLEAAEDQGKVPGAFMNLVRGKRVDGLVIANPRASERQFVDQLVSAPRHDRRRAWSSVWAPCGRARCRQPCRRCRPCSRRNPSLQS